MNTIKNIQIIKRFYSTPRGISNFKVVNTPNNNLKYIKPVLRNNSSYMNMYNVLKSRKNKYIKSKKD